MPDFFQTRFGTVPGATAAGSDVQIHRELLEQALKNRGYKNSPTNLNGEQIIINLENDGEYDFHITFQAATGQQFWFDRAHYCIRKDGPAAEDREYNSVIYWWYKFVVGGLMAPQGNVAPPAPLTNVALGYSFQTPIAGGGCDKQEMLDEVKITDEHNPINNTSWSTLLNNLVADIKKLGKEKYFLYYKKTPPAVGWKMGPPPK